MSRAVAVLVAVTALFACVKPGQVEAELHVDPHGLARRMAVLCRLGLGLAADAPEQACVSPEEPEAEAAAVTETGAPGRSPGVRLGP